jgi:hypothetical protein
MSEAERDHQRLHHRVHHRQHGDGGERAEKAVQGMLDDAGHFAALAAMKRKVSIALADTGRDFCSSIRSN